MHTGACRASYRLVFGVGRILVVTVEGMLNVQAGIWTGENEWSSHSRFRCSLITVFSYALA
jgi:hypothetical protein